MLTSGWKAAGKRYAASDLTGDAEVHAAHTGRKAGGRSSRGLTPVSRSGQGCEVADDGQNVPFAEGNERRLPRRALDTIPTSCVLVSAVYPVPTSSGKRVVLMGMLDYLVDRFGAGNVHYLLLDDEVPPGELPCAVHLLGRPGTLRKLWNVFSQCLFGRRTLQEALTSSPSVKKKLHSLLRQLKPDLEIYDTLRLAQLVEEDTPDCRRVVYLDDLYSVRYEGMLKQMAEDPGIDVRPLGDFVRHIPGPLRGLGAQPAVYRPLLRFEGRRVAVREAECVKRFDLGLLVNAEEVDVLRSRAPEANVDVLTPLIAEGVPTLRRPDSQTFVFLGLLSLPHNEDALTAFLTRTLAPALKVLPDMRLRIVGRDVSDRLRELADSFGSAVQLDGYVDDLNSVLSTCTALIAPLRFGSGVKIKVLEAVGRGIPVLATSVAAQGISNKSQGQDGLFIVDELTKWPDAMLRLTDPAVNAEASAAALRFYRRTYSRRVVHASYDRLFLGRLSEPSSINVIRRASVG